MGEKLMLFIAFILSLLGIIALYALSENIDYNEKTIEKINSEKILDMVKIVGEVERVGNSGNVTFITIQQPETIDVVVFDKIELNEEDNVEIIGKSEEYNNKIEIIAHRIRIIQ
jgi:aspartyl/asparaginyl-tRNA synthetase